MGVIPELIKGESHMFVKDLGAIDASIVLFGGTYSNAHATQALINWAQDAGINHLINTGDVVAYCADAAETIAIVRSNSVHVIKGNCEVQLAEDAPDCGCGFDQGTACDMLSVQWYAHARNAVSPSEKEWMATLPDWITFTHFGKRYVVIHGGAIDIARFIFSTSDVIELQNQIKAITDEIGAIDAVICGHSGIAFHASIGDIDWINAGVVGMPPNDGDPRTEFCVLSEGIVAFHRLAYDHNAASQAMQREGLVHGYHSALLTGIWPSQDVLPVQLRRDNG